MVRARADLVEQVEQVEQVLVWLVAVLHIGGSGLAIFVGKASVV